MPLIKARSSSIMDNVDLRGQPTAATAAQNVNTTQLASTAYVRTAVAALVDSAPGLLDTLNELAAAIADDASFSTTIANSIATKVALDGSVAMTGELTLSGAPTANLSATTKQYVDDLIDAQMIYSTDDVAEGSTNLYYTATRVKNLITLSSDNTSVLDYDSATGQFSYNHPNSDGVLEGATNLYFSNARARGAISMNSDDGTLLSYSSGTGVITFTTPDTDKVVEGATNLYFTTVRARGAVSAGSNIAYDSGTGIISTQAAVWSVNTQTGDVVLDTDDVSEGSANLYHTAVRVANAISLTTNDSNILSYANGVFTFVKPNTDAVAEGATNQYFTNVRVRAAISASGDISYNSATGNFSYSTPTTDGVAEGSTNLYHTATRARNAISITSDNTDVLDYDSATGVFTFSLGSQTTDDVAEGSTNLYYLDSRARLSISTAGWGNLSYNNGTGVITISAPDTDDVTEGATNQYFTNVRARNAVSATQSSGDGTFSYDNTTGVFTYVGPNDPDYRGAVSAVRASGDGDLQYNSATGVFTYTGPSAADTRAHFSATTVSGITYTQATGVFALASIPNSSLANSSITINGATIALGASDTLDADDIAEAVDGTNKYYTQGRFNTAFTAKTTSDLAEGTNEYFTQTRARNSLVAGTGVTYTAGSGTIAIGQAVGTTDDVTFNDVTVAGDLTVNGTLTAINSTTVTIADLNITLADGAANAAAANGAGLTVAGASATITYASGTDSWNFNKDVNITGGLSVTTTLTAPTFTGNLTGNVTGNVTGNLTGNVTGNVTGQVSDISNHDTDALSEGATNLYYTDTRSRAALSGGNSGTGHGSLSYNSATGAFTFAKVTSSNIRGEVSANKVSGDGNFSYDSATGVFSYTGPSAADARAHFSATTATGAAFDQATGIISLANIPNASLAYSNITINGATIALGGSDTLDTDDVLEGATNEYFTQTRARNAISLTTSDANTMSYDPATGVFDFDLAGMTTDEVAEGSTNLYYLDSRARLSISASGWGNLSYDNTSGVITISAPSTANVTEDATNKYFTDARARQAVSLTTDNSDALSYNNTTGVFSFTLSTVNTDEIAEGPTNFYFTTTRARNSISNGSNISYDAATGVISTQAAVFSVNTQTGVVVLDTDDISEGAANLYFTNVRAQNALTLVTDDANILSYATGTLTFTTPDTDSIDEGAVNLYYTNTRADDRIAAASIRDLSDVDADDALQDGYTLVWSSARGEFVPQNIAVTATTLNFTGDGTLTSFSTGVEVSSIDNTQVYINGLIQAPTYSYTLNTVSGISSIVFDAAPETNDYIFIRVSSTSTLTAGGILNESSNIDGGTY